MVPHNQCTAKHGPHLKLNLTCSKSVYMGPTKQISLFGLSCYLVLDRCWSRNYQEGPRKKHRSAMESKFWSILYDFMYKTFLLDFLKMSKFWQTLSVSLLFARWPRGLRRRSENLSRWKCSGLRGQPSFVAKFIFKEAKNLQEKSFVKTSFIWVKSAYDCTYAVVDLGR